MQTKLILIGFVAKMKRKRLIIFPLIAGSNKADDNLLVGFCGWPKSLNFCVDPMLFVLPFQNDANYEGRSKCFTPFVVLFVNSSAVFQGILCPLQAVGSHPKSLSPKVHKNKKRLCCFKYLPFSVKNIVTRRSESGGHFPILASLPYTRSPREGSARLGKQRNK